MVDSRRQIIEEGAGAILPITPIGKMLKELKKLEPTSNFMSYGTRSGELLSK